MHIKIDKNNKVCDIHIEKWDFLALPSKIADDLLNMQGGEENDFISFAFKNKVFLYTKTLFLLREDKSSLYLWYFSPLYGEEYFNSMNGTLNILQQTDTTYATFIYNSGKLRADTALMAQDKVLTNMFKSRKLHTEVIILSIEEIEINEIIKIFGLFNLVRNGENVVSSVENIKVKPIKIVNILESNYGYIVAIDKNERLYALTSSDILHYSDDELKQFQAFKPTEALDEKHSENLKIAMNRIVELKNKI